MAGNNGRVGSWLRPFLMGVASLLDIGGTQRDYITLPQKERPGGRTRHASASVRAQVYVVGPRVQPDAQQAPTPQP
jgi:hypothetical protein